MLLWIQVYTFVHLHEGPPEIDGVGSVVGPLRIPM